MMLPEDNGEFVPGHPGHILYDNGRMMRFEASGPMSVAQMCHELMLDPGFTPPSPVTWRQNVFESMDLRVIEGDLALKPPSFESMFVLLDHQIRVARRLVGISDEHSPMDHHHLFPTPDETHAAFDVQTPPCIFFKDFFDYLMGCYERVYLADEHAIAQLALSGEICAFRDFLVAVLGRKAVPAFQDTMRQSEKVFQERMGLVRLAWDAVDVHHHTSSPEISWSGAVGFLG